MIAHNLFIYVTSVVLKHNQSSMRSLQSGRYKENQFITNSGNLCEKLNICKTHVFSLHVDDSWRLTHNQLLYAF